MQEFLHNVKSCCFDVNWTKIKEEDNAVCILTSCTILHDSCIMLDNNAVSMQQFTSLLHMLLLHPGNGTRQSKEIEKRNNELGDKERLDGTLHLLFRCDSWPSDLTADKVGTLHRGRDKR